MGSSIKPGHTSAHDDDVQLPALQVLLVYVSDFQFSARRGLKRCCNLEHLGIVKVHPSDGVSRLRALGLFLNAESLSIAVELYHSISLRILHRVSKYPCTGSFAAGAAHALNQIMPVKNIVAQHQCTAGVSDEFSANEKRLGDSLRLWLHGILEIQT